ncbi:hypothetical protein ABZV34_39185, partial [Streptomyces sp. NPDC005195]
MTPLPVPSVPATPSVSPDGPRPGSERPGEAGTTVLTSLEPTPWAPPAPSSAGGVGAGPPTAQPVPQPLRPPLMGRIKLESG